MNGRFAVVLLGVALVMTACPDLRPGLRASLESSRALWASQNVGSYRFTHNTFAAPNVFSYTITVENGAFQSATDARTGQTVSVSQVEGIKTMEAVFQMISAQIEANQLESVSYDARGVPVNTRFKPPSCAPGVADCIAGGSTITGFQVLP